MKMIFASKFYYRRGGLETYLLKSKKLIEREGHVVIPFSTNYYENIYSEYSEYNCNYFDLSRIRKKAIYQNVRAFNNMFFNLEAYKNVKKLCLAEQPQILQGFGVTKHLSASIFKAAKDCGVRTIMRLSDYALMCPSTIALDGDGKVCPNFDCYSKFGFKCLDSKCVKHSLLASLIGLVEIKGNKFLGYYKRFIDHWIAPSEFIRDIFIKYYKIPENKITYLPIYFDVTNIDVSYEDDGYILFAGRISEEKGLNILMDAIMKETRIELVVAGSGPLENKTKEFIETKNLKVRFMGPQSFEELKSLIKGAKLIVVPSVCYENSPNIILEAYAFGKPVIGARIGGIPELIKENITGLTFEPGNSEDLREKIIYMWDNPIKVKEMGRNARCMVEKDLNKETHYNNLMNIYQTVSNC